MLPGLRRTQWAPASSALSASVWLKWMSAMIGIGESLTICFRTSASFSRGTAQRIRSAHAYAAARIWRIVASKSAVSVFVIVWTATGAPPPIGTPPTHIWRLEAMHRGYPPGSGRPHAFRHNGNLLVGTWGRPSYKSPMFRVLGL